jgi:hypothetical protein
MFVFLFSAKVVRLPYIYRHSPMLTGGNVVSLSEVWTSAIFGMVEAVGLKITTSRSPSMAWPSTKFHKNLRIGSKVDGIGPTDRQVIS